MEKMLQLSGSSAFAYQSYKLVANSKYGEQ